MLRGLRETDVMLQMADYSDDFVRRLGVGRTNQFHYGDMASFFQGVGRDKPQRNKPING